MVDLSNTEAQIYSVLTRPFWNNWWSSGRMAVNVPEFRRSDFSYIAEKLETDTIIVTGARQTGKTTIVWQLIKKKLDEGIDPKRILYAELDEASLQTICDKQTLVLDVIKTYEKRVLQEDIWRTTNPFYIFLDEVQTAPNWADTIKSLKASPAARILVTGSAGFRIAQQGKETLPGRKISYELFSLKFADATRLESGITSGTEYQKIDALRHGLRQALETALKNGTVDALVKAINDTRIALTDKEVKMQADAQRYLLRGGYPKPIITKHDAEAQRLIEDYSEDIIMKDLGPYFGVKDPVTARKLLYLLASGNGQELNVNTLLQRLRESTGITVNKYINSFEEAAILARVENWSKTKYGSTKHPKVYFNDCGFRNALIGKYGVEQTDEETGVLAETAVHDHVRRLAFKLNGIKGNVFFNKNATKETDFMLKLTRLNALLPIEVKYRRRATKGIKNLDKTILEENAPFGLCITQSEFFQQGKVIGLPLWMFLFLC